MKKFIVIFFLSSTSIFALCVGLITAIDPYDKMGNNFFGFATKAVAQSRENKFYLLESSKKDYTAFILGSSAAHRYPTEKVKKLTGLETYNYSVQHSTPIDYLAIVRHILSKWKPKLILLQLDFAALDETYRVDNRLFNSPLKKFLKEENSSKQIYDNNNFTLDALRDSFRVIYVNNFGKARHIYLADGNYTKEKITKKPIKIRQGNHSSFVMSKKRIEILKDLKALCDANNIKLVAFSAPLSLGHLNKIRNNPKLKILHDQFKNELTQVFSEFWDFENETIKGFNDYRFFHDSTHPTKKMSSLVLQAILARDEHNMLGKRLSIRSE